jgi:Mrp family chromosome partitioning ATPase/LPS O-antigen subunit length determinant protein (WzzB/FepE family)
MLQTLWKRRLTILVCIVVAVGATLAYSKYATPTYESSALVQINTPSQVGGTTSTFTLPDPVQELLNTNVQIAAAKALGVANPATVADQVTGTVDPTTGTLTVTGSGSTPQEAVAVADAYSEAFVNQIHALAESQIAKYTTALAQNNVKIAALQAQELPLSTNALLNAQISALTQTSSTLEAAQSAIQIGMPYAEIQVAATPGSLSGLSKSKLGAIGLLAGLLVGCGIALVREQFDDRVRISPDIESVIDGPVLGELPQDSDVKKGDVTIALVQAPQSFLAEAVRDLRTSLRVLLVDQQSPILVVTSPEAGDGKTFVTANLATSWALTGSRVIVVSADFRRPRLEQAFGINASGNPGLSDLIKANWKQAEPDGDEFESTRGGHHRELSGLRQARHISTFAETAVSTYLLETGIDGLRLLPVGVHLDNPSELFDSPGMQPVLDQLHLLADIILLDTPPVLGAPDTAILGSMTYGAIVVASEGKTDRSDLERTSNRLESTGCNVLGLVLNHVRHSASDSYASYSYKR